MLVLHSQTAFFLLYGGWEKAVWLRETIYGCMNAWLFRFASHKCKDKTRTTYKAGEMWTETLSGRENWTPIATGNSRSCDNRDSQRWNVVIV